MVRFRYTELGPDGTTNRGDVDAEGEAQALDALAGRGLLPLALDRGAASDGPSRQRDIALLSPPGRLGTAEQARLLSIIGALLWARLPPLSARALAETRARDARGRRAARAMRAAVEGGQTLARGMQDTSPAFPENVIAAIASGEAANRLDTIVSRTTRTLETQAQLGRTLRAAPVYPALLVGMALLVLAMIAFHLAPTLLPVFASAGTSPPAVLRLAAGLGEVLSQHWPLILAAIGSLILVGRALRQPLGLALAPVMGRLPFIAPHRRRHDSLRLVQALSLMLDAGAPLIRALAQARTAVRTPAFARLLAEAEASVTAGGTLRGVLEPTALIDPMAMALIAAGEEADCLPDSLQGAARLLEVQVAAGIARAMQLVTPLLTLAIGLAVGGLILATVGAIMDINDLAL